MATGLAIHFPASRSPLTRRQRNTLTLQPHHSLRGQHVLAEVWTADGTLIILDCGTGAHGLGLALAAAVKHPLRGHLMKARALP